MQDSEMKVNKPSDFKTVPFQEKYDGLEIKSGGLLMDQNLNGRMHQVPVFVRVYKTLFDHYVIVYRNEKIPSTAVHVSLKSSQVYKGDRNNIHVIPDNVEGTKLTFYVKTEADVVGWITALTPTCTVINESCVQSFTPPSSPVIPKSPSMPPVPESEEG